MAEMTEEEYDRIISEETERAHDRSRSPRGILFAEADEGKWLELQHEGWCVIQYGQLWCPKYFGWTYRKGWQPTWWKLITM